MESDKHIRAEIAFGYRNGLLTPAELRDLDAHLSVCAICRQQLAASMGVEADSAGAALRKALTEARPQAESRSLIWYAIAAALAVAFGLGAWLAIGRHGPAANEIAAVAETHHTALVEEQRKVDAALRSGSIALPEFVQDLHPKREVLMGSSPAARMELATPAATAVPAPRPVFRWTSLGENWKYRVQVFAPGFQLSAESPELNAREWTPGMDLPTGVNLEWQVIAVRGNQRLTFPQPPAVPPRFRVLDAATIARIKQLAAQPGATNLMLAVAYAEAGAIDDARRELETAVRDHPDRLDWKRLLDSLTPR